MEITNEESRFMQLLGSMQAGWEIEEPVMLDAMWYCGPDGKSSVYHFVLRNKVEDKTTLFSLPPSPQLLAFLSENRILVNSR